MQDSKALNTRTQKLLGFGHFGIKLCLTFLTFLSTFDTLSLEALFLFFNLSERLCFSL